MVDLECEAMMLEYFLKVEDRKPTGVQVLTLEFYGSGVTEDPESYELMDCGGGPTRREKLGNSNGLCW